MDRTNSFSGGQRPTPPNTAAPFAYQQRLLERTSSRGGGSLSRANSATATAILSNPTGTRRYTPSHRSVASLDGFRGKAEERLRTEAILEGRSASPDTRFDPPTESPSPSKSTEGVRGRYAELLANAHSRRNETGEYDRTPTALKRRTLPEPIIASPLSPNNTGMTIESPDDMSFSTPTSNRIHLPVTRPLEPSSPSPSKRISQYASRYEAAAGITPTPTPRTRAYTLDSIAASSTGSSTASDATTSSSITSASSRTFSDAPSTSNLQRRPASVYGGRYTTPSIPSSPEKPSFSSRTRSYTASSRGSSEPPETPQSPTKPSSATFSAATISSAMTPAPYRSSYMNKKRLPEHMLAGRRLGRHLPRIASGDAPDDWVADDKTDEEPPLPPLPPPDPPEADWRSRRAARERRAREALVDCLPAPSRSNLHDIPSTVGEGDDVAGMRGRLRLSRDIKAPSTPVSPLPSSRLTRGLWADVQRNLLQAYEYLCHVGEAQQWIEGCLGEELPFGVVEMEEGMRNGVVLAKLVRVFLGEQVVKRIYEVRNVSVTLWEMWLTLSKAPKLDFRHSDNINIFFKFVEHVGLPEVGYCFEPLTCATNIHDAFIELYV